MMDLKYSLFNWMINYDPEGGIGTVFWILDSGNWNDAGTWDDTALWDDGV